VDLPGKVNGTARYAIDVQVPNMLYAAVLRAPVEGSVPDKIDDAKAKAVAGVVRIVRMPYGVAVLAETPWAAFEARQALTQSVTWTRTGTAWGFDSDKGIERFAADAKNPARGATEWSRIGDVRGQMPKAASMISMASNNSQACASPEFRSCAHLRNTRVYESQPGIPAMRSPPIGRR